VEINDSCYLDLNSGNLHSEKKILKNEDFGEGLIKFSKEKEISWLKISEKLKRDSEFDRDINKGVDILS
jgi:hypothetical protein